MTLSATAATAMYFEQFYLGCLAHASYLLGSHGEAVVVDPQRDVDIYLATAKEHGLTIRHIFETHLHADFVSGHKELAGRTGATIYIGAQAGATFPHVALKDGFELPFGRAKLTVLETPGHTPESICLLVTDEEKSSLPWAVLTGDTLFIGDVGRPDLSPTHTPAQLAGQLYDSLHNQLMTLPDDVAVYPAHGAGSLCGRNMRAERSSTIGTERRTNYALQIPNREEFIQQMTSNLPTRPAYFQTDAAINRDGAPSLAELSSLRGLAPAEVRALIDQGAPVLDVRSGDQFAAGHVPGSINIALSGQFATWAGTILGTAARPILIADSEAQLEEARVRLARVGIDTEGGFLAGGVDAWKAVGFELATQPQISAEDLQRLLPTRDIQILDVRRETEWSGGHLPDAQLWPLDKFNGQLPAFRKTTPIVVHCKGGYRSMIACSLLERAGFMEVVNLAGGYDAWILFNAVHDQS
jgi:hydroxyacylglutathione hydrolase